MKTLLVDDSLTIRNIQKNMLKQLGHTDVVEAEDGLQALIRMKEHKIDLMLVEWSIPNMDGITLVRKVRETNKTIPIIMCATEAEKTRVLEAIKAGVNSYIVKPFTFESFAGKLNQALSRMTASAPA